MKADGVISFPKAVQPPRIAVLMGDQPCLVRSKTESTTLQVHHCKYFRIPSHTSLQAFASPARRAELLQACEIEVQGRCLLGAR